MSGDLYTGMVFGGAIAALWSFLMARYVAGPRAKTLMVGTLKGDTEVDKKILHEIRGNLIRPEIDKAFADADFKAVSAQLTDLSVKVSDWTEDMPEIDTAPLMERLDALEKTLPDAIGTHVAMHYKAIQATEAKSINKALEEMGINLEGAANEAQEFVEAQLPPEMIAMKKLLTAKIPKGLKESSPTWAWLIQQARDAGGGLILSRLQQRAGMGIVETAPASTGFGVR